jgi:MFS family permease
METIPADEPALETGAQPTRKTRLPVAFSSFRHRNFRLWFLGSLVSMVGTWMQIIAQGWLVYQISHSEFALGLVGFASAIPALLISPIGGVATDRIPRRTLLLLTQSAQMLFAFILCGLALANVVQVWHVVVLAVLGGVVTAFDAPARQIFVIDMVGREDLTNAIALNSTMFNTARVLGPAFGGLVLAAVGATWCFFLNGLSFLAVIGGLLLMQFPQLIIRRSTAHPMRQLVEGLAYVRGRRDIMAILVLTIIYGVFGVAYSSQLPAFVDQVLHERETAYALLNTGVGVGALTAGLILAQYGSRIGRGWLVVTSSLVYPFLLLIFAFNQSLNLALVLSFFLGMGFLLLFNNFNSLLQLNSSDEMRGRVMGLYTLVFFGFSPFGSLLIGVVAEHISLSLTIGLSAGITLVLAVAVFLLTPELRKL